MKKISKLLFILLISACSQRTETLSRIDEIPQTEELKPAVIRSLEQIDSSSSSAEVYLVFSTLLNETAKAYSSGLQIRSSAYDRSVKQLSSDLLTSTEYNVQTLYSSWISSQCLYQVSRYLSDSAGKQTGDIVLSKLDEQQELELICSLEDPLSYDHNPLSVTISRIEQEKTDIEGEYDQSRFDQMLINRQLQYIYGTLGSYLAISPMDYPELFDFSLAQTKDGYRMEITAPDLALYNRQAQLSGNRNDLYGDGSILVEGYQTETVWIALELDDNGIVRSVESVLHDGFAFEGQNYQIVEEEQLTISPIPAGGALDGIETVFSQITSQKLKIGSSIELDVPVAQDI